MPSNAYKVFNTEYKKDIERLLSNYEELKGTHQGRRSLDHLFRSGVLLLSAAWEVYIEDVLVESVHIVAKEIDLESVLNPVKKTLCKAAAKEKDELAVLNLLGGDNWRGFYMELVEGEVLKLHNPKSGKIDELYQKYLGIDTISSNFTEDGLDDFLTARGEIAHRMKGAEYLKKDVFINYVRMIDHLVDDVDEFLYGNLKLLLGRTPWNNTYRKV